MNCAECQQICLETGGRNLPAACAEHVTGCDGCRKVFERTLVVSRLLALKKYEHPDPLFEIRNAAVIRGNDAGLFRSAELARRHRRCDGRVPGRGGDP